MGEQVRSQPIVTNRSEISHGTSNCVKTLTLLLTKLHLEPYQTQAEVCLQHHGWAEIISVKKRREGKTSYTVAVKISSCLNFSFTSASVYVNTSTPTQRHTRKYTAAEKYTPVHTHAAILPVKHVGKPVRLSQRKANLFIYLSSE